MFVKVDGGYVNLDCVHTIDLNDDGTATLWFAGADGACRDVTADDMKTIEAAIIKTIAEKDKELAELKADYAEVRGRLQAANLIKDEQKEKADKLLSCLRCLAMRDLIKDCPEKDSAIEIIKGYSL